MARTIRFFICNIDFLRRNPLVAIGLLAAFLFTCVFPCQPALGQTTTATLTGTVFDASGAVVVSATVTLKNEASGDLRSTVSNSEGYFTFAAVPPATYSVSVEKEGFKVWEAKGIVLNSADKRNVIGIKLAREQRARRSSSKLHSRPSLRQTLARNPPSSTSIFCRTSLSWARTRQSSSRSCRA